MAADLSKALLDEAEAGPDAVVVGGRTLNGGKPARLSDASGSDADSDAGSDKEPKTCCGFAGSFADETNRMVALAWPVAIGYLSTSAMTTVDMGFVGHLGKDELAAMSVSNVVMMGTFGESKSTSLRARLRGNAGRAGPRARRIVARARLRGPARPHGSCPFGCCGVSGGLCETRPLATGF